MAELARIWGFAGGGIAGLYLSALLPPKIKTPLVAASVAALGYGLFVFAKEVDKAGGILPALFGTLFGAKRVEAEEIAKGPSTDTPPHKHTNIQRLTGRIVSPSGAAKIKVLFTQTYPIQAEVTNWGDARSVRIGATSVETFSWTDKQERYATAADPVQLASGESITLRLNQPTSTGFIRTILQKQYVTAKLYGNGYLLDKRDFEIE